MSKKDFDPFASKSVGLRGSDYACWRQVSVGVNVPEATKSQRDGCGREKKQSLPPRAPAKVYDISDLENLQRGRTGETEGIQRTFVFGIPDRGQHGLWLDLTQNQRDPNFHWAALISSQGVCALTGKPSDPEMRKFPGGAVPQNYLATTATGLMWLDGYCTEGAVRQFLFAKDKSRSVAASILDDQEVQSIEVTFFRSRETKGARRFLGPASRSSRQADQAIHIGAGALINQRVLPDPENLDFWQKEPTAKFVLRYVWESDLGRFGVRSARKPQRRGSGDGPLSGVQVGN